MRPTLALRLFGGWAALALAACSSSGGGSPGDGADADAADETVAPDDGNEAPVETVDVPGEEASGEDADAPEDAAPPDRALYVAPDGSGGICSFEQPCSLVEARDKVRTMTATMTEDLVVRLRGGRYELAATFELTGDLDSGRNGFRVLWQAYTGETPVLSGGRVLSGWVLVDAARNLYRVAAGPAGLDTRQLYVNGVRAMRVRGAWMPSGFAVTGTGYTAPDASMAGWRNPTDVEFVSLRYWKAFRCGVASISGTAVTMDEPCWSLAQFHSGYGMAEPSWIENAFELLGAPGQWYLDRAEGFVYYVPREGEDLAAAEVIAPVLETLVRGVGTADAPLHDVVLEGLTFAHATWLGPNTTQGYPALQAGWFLVEPVGSWTVDRTPGNVDFRYAQDVELRANRFTQLGACALVFERGSKRNRVVGNVFRDVSGGGIQIGDVGLPIATDPRDIVEANEVLDNCVTETGREYFDSVGLFVGYTAGTVIDHNEVSNLPYTGISVGWGWSPASTDARENRVTNNLVHHVMQRLEDGGMIYTLSAQPDSVIQGNWLHDQLHPYGGIYLDNGTNFYAVTGNVVASAPYWYLVQSVVAPGAQNNVLQFNFSDTDRVHCCGGLGCCTDPVNGNTISDNVVFAPGAWPAEALAITNAAGLEPEFAHLSERPWHIEAEDYLQGGEGVGYHDLTPGNAGGADRSDDVDLYHVWSLSNDVCVGWTQTGEWLRYYLDGHGDATCTFRFSTATIDDGCAIDLAVDGVPVGTAAVPNTGSYQVFRTAELPGVHLTPGPHLVTLTFTGGFNLDELSW